MPKTFPLDVKERALELYLQGHSSKDIAESLRTEFSNDVTQSTVYAWIKQDDWDLKKKNIMLMLWRIFKKLKDNASIVSNKNIGMTMVNYVIRHPTN